MSSLSSYILCLAVLLCTVLVVLATWNVLFLVCFCVRASCEGLLLDYVSLSMGIPYRPEIYVCSYYVMPSRVGWMRGSSLYSWSSCASLYVGLASRDACVLPFPVSWRYE